jgi:hypothetical protein
VHKDILAAALRLNKAISLGRVEPLHVTGGHPHSPCIVCQSTNRGCYAMQEIRVLGDDLRAAQYGRA